MYALNGNQFLLALLQKSNEEECYRPIHRNGCDHLKLHDENNDMKWTRFERWEKVGGQIRISLNYSLISNVWTECGGTNATNDTATLTKKRATMNLAIMRKVAEICIHSLFVYRFIDSTVQCLLFSLSHTSSSSVQVITKDFVLFRIFFALSSLALRFEPCVCVMISLLLGVHR